MVSKGANMKKKNPARVQLRRRREGEEEDEVLTLWFCVALGVTLNILKELPHHLTPRAFTTNLTNIILQHTHTHKISYWLMMVMIIVRETLTISDSEVKQSCIKLISDLLDIITTTSSPSQHHTSPPHIWWCVVEAVVRGVCVIGGLPSLVLEAGNLVLHSLSHLTHQLIDNDGVNGDVSEVAYSMVGLLHNLITITANQSHQLGDKETTTTTTTAPALSPHTLTANIEAALRALNPSSMAFNPTLMALNPSSMAFNPASMALNPSSMAFNPSSMALNPSPMAPPNTGKYDLTFSQPNTLLHSQTGQNTTITTPLHHLPTTTTTTPPPYNFPITNNNNTTTPLHHIPTTTTPLHHIPTTTTPLHHIPTTTTPLHHIPTTTTPLHHIPITTKTPNKHTIILKEKCVLWNLIYWRSVLCEQCLPSARNYSLLRHHLTDTISLIDRFITCAGI
ncbi:hypothetical protein Pmani_004590 [Petrolisthes manimaculis]|uniref:Uncharacterized protein n=1 Tax=Petrolisthes manimaculis TaxID=1843537 RepID=A0AAE1QDT5_9EUCA|nr:hypothetical protein Pmani_004590 [Petrolisthes manimaculis]